ncbi:hypothetical protein EVAR_6628_1 [Eumeta japonica]|uniref:Uncharacterized protein n=1 Tax=Eumeta variegata TaxID=151549 RepID=A0A4C1TMS3_EUMVA|nr:hypothetical protein EVAR_6628_1 [Eumeta japonica]
MVLMIFLESETMSESAAGTEPIIAFATSDRTPKASSLLLIASAQRWVNKVKKDEQQSSHFGNRTGDH